MFAEFCGIVTTNSNKEFTLDDLTVYLHIVTRCQHEQKRQLEEKGEVVTDALNTSNQGNNLDQEVFGNISVECMNNLIITFFQSLDDAENIKKKLDPYIKDDWYASAISTFADMDLTH
jgi:hypothetical protein